MELDIGLARGGMLQPTLRHGQSALWSRPPSLQINEQPLLQSHNGIPLEIPLGVVLITSNGFAREFDPQSLQDPAQQ